VPLRIAIACPAPKGSRVGNRVTAERWARLLRADGHRVTIGPRADADVLIALHAVKTAGAVEAAAREGRSRIVVVLTGTDFQPRLGAIARQTLERADRIVMLYEPRPRELPRALLEKVRVIVQSAQMPSRRRRSRAPFRAIVVGHLREVKDPFRAAVAARRVAADSRLEIVHLGEALDPELRRCAEREMQRNPRYRWLGGVPRSRALQLVSDSDVFVLSSRAEGGASALSEAIVAGVPILATRISSVVAVLGDDYPGLFRVGATAELTALLERVEREPGFARRLRRAVAAKRSSVSPARERRALRRLIAEFM
jgi:putative glycosyltransferase (TIGR04348 family)